MIARCIFVMVAAQLVIGAARAEQALPSPDHVVVVIEENKGFPAIIESDQAPYIQSLAERGALFTQSYALAHPSQPNYIMLFAGTDMGVTDDNVPHNLPFTTPNLGAALRQHGLTFTGYSEDLPEIGFTGAHKHGYARKHNPWVNWQDAPRNGLPAECNLPFSAWPADYDKLPTFAFVVPNQDNDMHDGSIADGDAWLKEHLDGFIHWAFEHNSLLVLTFDEDGGKDEQRIATLFIGPMIRPGKYDRHIDHYDVLRTFTDMYGLPAIAAAEDAHPIDFCWQPQSNR